MSDRMHEPTEYRSDTELITYQEYNDLYEELGFPPEYNPPEDEQEGGEGPGRPKAGFWQLLVSAFRGGGAVLCALALIGALASAHGSAMGQTSKALGEHVEAGKRPAILRERGYSAGAFKQLWDGDPEGPHDYDLTAPTRYSEATCTEDGAAEYVCRECGTVLSEVLAAKGHDPEDPVHENEVEATCSAEGSYEEVVYCSVCGEELSREAVQVAVQPHTPGEAAVENEVEPGCETEGSRELVTCCVYCGTELSRETESIPAAGHKAAAAVRENVKAATCTKTGSYQEVVYCSVCHEELSRTTRTIAKTSHTRAAAVKENEVAATCTAGGHYDEVVYCSQCKTELSRKTVATSALGHSAGSAKQENVVAATCEAGGHYDEVTYCTRCNTELSRKTVTTAALGHTAGEEKKENVDAATCTDKGSY